MTVVRLVRLMLLALLVTSAVLAEEGASVAEDCGTPGECANPEAASSAEAVEPEAAASTETVDAAENSVEVTPDTEDAPTPVEDPEPQVEEEVAITEEDPKCPSRPHIVRCAAEHLDTDKNSVLERTELEAAINKLPWYARGILQIIGSVDKIMKKCDSDGDDAISIEVDMDKTKDTCLATCFKRRAFKSAFFPDCDA